MDEGVRVIEAASELSEALERERRRGRSVGLVPTMGALHEGHLSLVERAVSERDTVCVSVFVNPLQFGPGEDLATYPRDLDGDVLVAQKAGAAVVFAPTTAEMLPPQRRTAVHVEHLGDVLEGTHRPGHLDGVATVVAKLFALAGPCHAYFGEKDWQQLVVVRRVAADLSLPVEVVACPTVRARDGLALSSRKEHLDATQRESAAVLFRALRAGAAAIIAGEGQPAVVADLMASIIEAEPPAALDYAEVVDAHTLEVPPEIEGEVRLLVAARFGATRLVDNLGVNV